MDLRRGRPAGSTFSFVKCNGIIKEMDRLLLRLPSILLFLLAPILVSQAWAVNEFAEGTNGPIHLSLESAIEQGIKNATAILKASNSEEEAAIQVLKSYSQLYPN